MLLRYTVMQCGAGGGALFRCGPGGELDHLVHTDGWTPAGDYGIAALWREAQGALAAGQPQRRDELLLWPLFDSEHALVAVVAFAGVSETASLATMQRDLLERLRIEATSALPRDPLRALLAALSLLAGRWSRPDSSAA